MTEKALLVVGKWPQAPTTPSLVSPNRSAVLVVGKWPKAPTTPRLISSAEEA
jgi:hypothetical protein